MFWIVEVFVWVLLLFLVSGTIMVAKYNYRKQFNTYQIFLPDVDGLIDGSPVKIMGIQIGYVNQIDIVGEDVYVKFIITDSKVRIPAGSIATVEFSGLGGSKSLELYPPKGKSNPSGKFIVSQPPKRIHDSLGLLNDMFKQLADLTYTASHFMNQVGIIKQQEMKEKNAPTNKSAHQILQDSNSWIDKAQHQVNIVSDRINGKNKDKGKKGGNGEDNEQR